MLRNIEFDTDVWIKHSANLLLYLLGWTITPPFTFDDQFFQAWCMAFGKLLHELYFFTGTSNESDFDLFKGVKSNAISLATLW